MSGCGIVSRVTPVHRAVRNCTRDEGGPFEVGNQVDLKPPQAAVVKSNGGERCGKVGTRFRQGLSFGGVHENNVPGIYDGPFLWEDTFGFRLAGMVGNDFFKSYAVTFDFEKMQMFLHNVENMHLSREPELSR